MASYPFLSSEWIDAARKLREEYAEQIPVATVSAKVNVVVTDIPHGDDPTLEGHIDTNSGQTIIEQGHLDDPELTVTVDYATARAAFVTRDQTEVMQAFLTGKILVDGDASRLLALASGPPSDIDPVAIELYEKLDALTLKD
ncbi:MAG: SCP2 sterol-binding domain-containing protein [Acidimicrobiales bacterium]